jgi:3-deoxy-D-manno-octulosonate 8-phosphate phosphatase (KDO 8-P phosphatase)
MVDRHTKLRDRLPHVTTLALDVDGVLTDGAVWWGANGEELKRFSFRDIMGVSLARQAGLRIALVTGEQSPIVDRLAEKLTIADVLKGWRDKHVAMQMLMTRHRLRPDEVCYVGDDVNDLPAFETVGVPVTVADAAAGLAHAVVYRTRAPGGCGAVREIVEMILACQNKEVAAACQQGSHS